MGERPAGRAWTCRWKQCWKTVVYSSKPRTAVAFWPHAERVAYGCQPAML